MNSDYKMASTLRDEANQAENAERVTISGRAYLEKNDADNAMRTRYLEAMPEVLSTIRAYKRVCEARAVALESDGGHNAAGLYRVMADEAKDLLSKIEGA